MNGAHMARDGSAGPRSIAPAAGRRGAPPVGRRLTRQAVVARAGEVIARDGLAAFSLRGLAADLGVGAGALYNHVRDRDDLLDAVAERFVMTFDLPDADLAWPQWLREVARRMRRHMLAHPHLADMVVTRRPHGPGRRPLLRRFVGHLEAGGVDPATAHVAWHALLHLLVGAVLQERGAQRDGTEVFEATLDVVVEGVVAVAGRPADARAAALAREHGLTS